ncbi:hypothetical protein J2T07_001679 [Luteibacter jiangsuensis]|uniref:DUF1120 domain-containing protein n=1 Tax=Luteibacter jiangsuensis TaxID=637577 RepID=A0ABT9SZY8_9GAMM|nr:hypothetical protein [Luteibacter jiangsuensis]MDQ0009502.1 hypothetical protein [Luteibacter jiangsuensis]
MISLRTPSLAMRLARRVVLTSMLLPAPVAYAREAICEVTTGTARIDYGRLSRATTVSAESGELALPLRTARLDVSCSQPEDMTVFFRAMPLDARVFRFVDRGRFSLRLRDGLLDGERVDLGQLDRPGTTPARTGASLPWLPEQGIAPVKAGHVVTGRVFSAYIDIDTRLDADALVVGDATQWLVQGRVEAAGGATRDLFLHAEAIAGSCSVEVVRNISFGTLRSTDLDTQSAFTIIHPTQRGELQVHCDAPMPIALRVQRDERAGTVAEPAGLGLRYTEDQLFGLGTHRTGANIGSYVLRWGATAISDQGELLASRSPDGGRSWAPATGNLLVSHAPAERMGYASPHRSTDGPAAVTTLDVVLDAEIYIAPARVLPRSEEIEADGVVSFEIIY